MGLEFCAADVARYQLPFQRTIPGFEPSPASFKISQDNLAELGELLAQCGVSDPETLDLFTALGTGLTDRRTAVPAIRRSLRSALAVTVVLSPTACAGDDGDSDGASSPAPSTDATDAAAATTTSTPGEPPCGVTLTEVQALLPSDSGVTENATPDPGRCNFTWDDGGPAASMSPSFPADDRPPGSLPATSPSTATARRPSPRPATAASAFAFVGDDLYAADVVADGTDATAADLRDRCLQLLDLALD